jgi:hypothetical protein
MRAVSCIFRSYFDIIKKRIRKNAREGRYRTSGA